MLNWLVENIIGMQLKSTYSSRWWKEVKSLGDLKSNKSWPHQLLSDTNPTFHDLAESYNKFLIGLTSHFEPLPKYTSEQELQVPGFIGSPYS